jgi:hypothetical protein
VSLPRELHVLLGDCSWGVLDDNTACGVMSAASKGIPSRARTVGQVTGSACPLLFFMGPGNKQEEIVTTKPRKGLPGTSCRVVVVCFLLCSLVFYNYGGCSITLQFQPLLPDGERQVVICGANLLLKLVSHEMFHKPFLSSVVIDRSYLLSEPFAFFSEARVIICAKHAN